ncbi:Ribonuclease Z [Candidatus Clavichlamydia salmonicola]|uniref:ribonuclease Z n=1 Tax=Candidatus Clavichlamydia salmonicola TaxID=469812 RepID=UPI001890C291|nr:ribonuclease Z [Candidatus Clavichlamydia salmonicola]MBF5050940.1 Ribonuclease Z [Candidatus Clavichlamydia salmonicola]
MSLRELVILGSSSQQPTRQRNHGAYLIRWNGEGLLFDPGEGTQRQFIFANIAPPTVTRIFISHFHGDHCLGLGSMLMRLNLDKVRHTIHCYYPASGKKFFDRLRYGTMYHETITVIEHPVSEEGVVEDLKNFLIEAVFLDHGVENIAWRITEPDVRRFDAAALKASGIHGPAVRLLSEQGFLKINDRIVQLDDVSWIQKGDSVAVISDTALCPQTVQIAKNARLLLCESTYLSEHEHLARNHFHLTAAQAASIAKDANVEELVLTHFSARYRDLSLFFEEAAAIFPNIHIAEDLKVIPFPKK